VNRKYRSEPLAAIHEAVEALHSAGMVDEVTMRRFEEACVVAGEGDLGGREAGL
jgi:putative transcriptional regulator